MEEFLSHLSKSVFLSRKMSGFGPALPSSKSAVGKMTQTAALKSKLQLSCNLKRLKLNLDLDLEPYLNLDHNFLQHCQSRIQ